MSTTLIVALFVFFFALAFIVEDIWSRKNRRRIFQQSSEESKSIEDEQQEAETPSDDSEPTATAKIRVKEVLKKIEEYRQKQNKISTSGLATKSTRTEQKPVDESQLPDPFATKE